MTGDQLQPKELDEAGMQGAASGKWECPFAPFASFFFPYVALYCLILP
jgi:hypothetical protein